jgi:hypothetical protein
MVVERDSTNFAAVDERAFAFRRNGGRDWPMEVHAAESKYLTTEEVYDRYRGGISVGMLRNCYAQRLRSPFIEIGKSVLYPARSGRMG